MTPFEDLIALRKYVIEQIFIETSRPSYNGVQRAIAYQRVLTRLSRVISRAQRVRDEFHFEEGLGSEL